jgi:hypothetical protein
MKTKFIVVAASALLASACGKDMGSPVDEGAAAATPETGGAVGKQPGTEKPAAAPSKPVRPGVDGEVTLEGKADAGALRGGKISIDFGDGDQVTGTVAIGESSLEIRGIREGANLRLWAFGPGAKGEGARRGTVWGKLADGVASGDIELSGPGGEPAMKGSWKGKAR